MGPCGNSTLWARSPCGRETLVFEMPQRTRNSYMDPVSETIYVGTCEEVNGTDAAEESVSCYDDVTELEYKFRKAFVCGRTSCS